MTRDTPQQHHQSSSLTSLVLNSLVLNAVGRLGRRRKSLNDLGRVTSHDSPRLDILGDDRAGTDRGAVADGDSAENGGAAADPDVCESVLPMRCGCCALHLRARYALRDSPSPILMGEAHSGPRSPFRSSGRMGCDGVKSCTLGPSIVRVPM